MKFVSVFVLVIMSGCANRSTYLSIYNADYSTGDGYTYRILENSVTVIESYGEIDSKPKIVWCRKFSDSPYLNYLCNLDTNIFFSNYRNSSVQDGLQLSFSFTKKKKKYQTHVSNYYSPQIDSIVTYVNLLVPERYRIWYDKEKLTEFND